MTLEAKEITCGHCGNPMTIDEEKDYCKKCGRRIFYDPKDQQRHKWNTYFIWSAIFSVLGLGVILFKSLVEIMW
jgi:DNA-directed RNA polymerase subunit RPC12/RpoP